MKILKQPHAYNYTQPLINRLLRVHASQFHHYRGWEKRGEDRLEYYDAKTRELLDRSNWRVKLIRCLGT